MWRVLAHGNAEALAERILDYPIERERARSDLSKDPESDLDHAFQTILRNRVQRGGIMAPGASLMKSGENGAGIASRWYPETLARRIRDISRHRDRLTFCSGDAFDLIPKHLRQKRTAFFVDPPYTASTKRAGKRLYGHNDVDHDRLFDLMAKAHGRAMLTYDDAPEVRALADGHGFHIDEVPMKNTHNRNMFELAITNYVARRFVRRATCTL